MISLMPGHSISYKIARASSEDSDRPVPEDTTRHSLGSQGFVVSSGGQ